MKLLSLQSNGDRIVRILEEVHANPYYAKNYLMICKQMVYDKCGGLRILASKRWVESFQVALDKSVEWLKGAAV